VQRTFTGVYERSGSLRSVTVKRGGIPLGEHSLERCKTGEDPATCTHNLVVEIGIPPPLEACTDINCPIVGLRVTGGSQNQSLDCDPDWPKLKDEIAHSCGKTYTVNKGTTCPDSPTALWATAEPWQCVAVQTGGAVGQVSAGMNERVLGNEKAKTCTAPNQWYTKFGQWDPGDTRIVQVFLTPEGTFTGSGNTTVPVQGFATFYVTGWTSNGGFTNPCIGNGDEIEGQGEAGYIYGRFIKYVQTLNSGSGSEPCDMTGFEACTAVLVE
jgi:hypothetical protein